MSLLEHQIQKVGVEVKMDLAGGLPPVHGNAGKLQQVFLNLFLNARDAMDGGGVLSVSHLGRRIRRRVWMFPTPATASRPSTSSAFTILLYHEGEPQRYRMGLAVTYGIVQEHKGSIEVSSRQGGTRFQLRLPWSRTVGQASGLSAAKQPVNAA